MWTYARRGRRSCSSLAWITMLGLAPGCSDTSVNGSKLVPILDGRGLLTYQFQDEMPPAPTASLRPNASPWPQQPLAATPPRLLEPAPAPDWIRVVEQQLRERQALRDAEDARRQATHLQRTYQAPAPFSVVDQFQQRLRAESLQRDRAAQQFNAAFQRTAEQLAQP